MRAQDSGRRPEIVMYSHRMTCDRLDHTAIVAQRLQNVCYVTMPSVSLEKCAHVQSINPDMIA